MKRYPSLILLAALLFAACGKDYSYHEVKGTVYVNENMQTPKVNDTLTFRETNSGGPTAWSKYLGQAVTDQHGRFAFSYIRNLDNPYQQSPAAKFQKEEYFLIIIDCDGDTLYYGNTSPSDKLELYPGCWSPWWSNDDPEPEPEPAPEPEEGGEE